MKCPFCGSKSTCVRDSRSAKNGMSVKRRRVCNCCNAKFITFEETQLNTIKVLKKDGTYQDFDRQKMQNSIEIALRKRLISREKIDEAINDIVFILERAREPKIKTSSIGNTVMEALFKIDRVAFIRFASVYMNFKDDKDFISLINKYSKK